MSAKQTVTTTTTTTRGWNEKNDNTKKTGKKVANAYAAKLSKARSSSGQSKRNRCPTCGRPL